jgi:hypothetical protein
MIKPDFNRRQAVKVKRESWWLWVGLPSLVVIGGLAIFSWWLYQRSCEAPSAPLINHSAYFLGTDPWIKGRQWTAINPDTQSVLAVSDLDGNLTLTDFPLGQKFSLQQNEWAADYLVTNQTDSHCRYLNERGDSREQWLACVQSQPVPLELDHQFDSWLSNWRAWLLLGQWEKLVSVTSLPSSVADLPTALNAWQAKLLSAGWQVDDLDLYLELPLPDKQRQVLLFWTLSPTSGVGASQIITTTAAVQVEDDTPRWQFSLASLPLSGDQ